MKEQKDEKGSVLDSLRNLARPLDNDETYCFYSGFIPPLIQVLPNEKDRDFAQIWLKKLDSEDEGPNRINYVLLLNYALQRGKLLTPFDRSPPPGKLSKIDNVLEWIILYEKANKDKGCGTQSLSSNRRKFTNDASSYDKTSSPNTYNIGEEKVDDRFIVNSISSGKAPVLSRSTPQDSLQQPKARMEAGGSVLKSPKKVRASLSAQRLPRGGSSKRRSRERERGRGSKSLTKSDGKSSPKLVASKSYVKSKANVNESEDSKSISIHVDIHLEFDKCNEAEKIAQVLPIKSNSKSRNTKRLQGSGRDSIGNSEKLKFTSIMKNLDSEEKEFKAKSETDIKYL